MSLINWFTKKPPVSVAKEADSSSLGHMDATVPFRPSDRNHEAAHGAPGSAANRKGERLERRELLYIVVRESMTKVGILSANYKFKVLSLDSKGRQYLVMMDLVRLYETETGRLAEIENLIAQSAKNRHDILVSSVYWRINEYVTTSVTGMPAPLPNPARVAESIGSNPNYEPLRIDEITAFKQALSSVGTSHPLASPGEIIRSGRRNPAPTPQFADTQLDDRPPPLSGTQYGDLI
jgi:hypothetical protein